MLLAIPLVYALESRAVAALHLGLCGLWLFEYGIEQRAISTLWALLLCLAPFVVWLRARGDRSPRNGLIAWLGIPLLILALAASAGFGDDSPLLAQLALACAGLYAAGSREQDTRVAFYAIPARAIGKLGIASVAIALCTTSGWDLFDDAWNGWKAWDLGAWVGVALGLAFLWLNAQVHRVRTRQVEASRQAR